MDENPTPAENTAVEDNSPATSPVPEPTTSTPEEPVDTESQSSSAEETGGETKTEPNEVEHKPSRAERTIRKKDRTIKDLQAELEKQRTSQSPGTMSPQPFDVRQYVDPEGNLDVEAVNNAINVQAVQTASTISQAQVQRQLDTYKAEVNLENDVRSLPVEYPEFDDTSEQFNPKLLEEVDKAYKDRAFRVVGTDFNGQPIRELDPNVRLADIAKSYAEAARSAVTRQSASTSASIAKTADEVSPTPGAQPPRQEREFKDLSKAEMEAKLGIVER